MTTLTALGRDARSYHTRYFTSFEEVEYIFGLTLTPEQREQVQTYITFGIRPDNKGCWTCSPAYVRKLTGQVDDYEARLSRGEVTWPWPVNNGQEVWELAHEVRGT